MRKLATIILLLSLLLTPVVPTVIADTISAGDYVKLISYNSFGNGGIMTYAVSHDGGNSIAFNYDTFCIQDNVYVWASTWYLVKNVSSTVGYYSTNIAGAGALNGAVDYLYAQYASGKYDNWFYTNANGTSTNNQYDFQATLWSLQGSGPAHTPIAGTPWAIDLTNYNTNYINSGDSWGTQVINIVSYYSNGEGYDIQNQLYHAVPEPTTLLLLGFGMMGLAGLKRKFQK